MGAFSLIPFLPFSESVVGFFLEAQASNAPRPSIYMYKSCEEACQLFQLQALNPIESPERITAMESPLVLGATVAATAMGGRYLLAAWQAFKARPVARRFYYGGFDKVMSKREAALILGVRERAVIEKIKEAHRRVMMANHPDAGGSHYLASKINEAKDVLTGKIKGTNSVF